LATGAFALLPGKTFTGINQENKTGFRPLFPQTKLSHCIFLFNLGGQLWGKLTNKKALQKCKALIAGSSIGPHCF
jgi:hypothetical protein